MPGHNDFVFSFFPHNGISFPCWDDNDHPWTVTVGFLIGVGRKDRHMTLHGRVGEFHQENISTGSRMLVVVQFVPILHVGKEVSEPDISRKCSSRPFAGVPHGLCLGVELTL